MSLDWSAFDEVAEALAVQGFNVIPLPPKSKGAGGSGITFKHLNKADSRRVTHKDREFWRRKFQRKGFRGTVGAYILPASGSPWSYAIVDVDDPEFEGKALETFGHSPLFVSRSGRVRHYYFRTDRPKEAHFLRAWGPKSVDIISTTGTVLPGSVHEDGGTYSLSIPIHEWTPKWVAENVPWLDLEKVRELRATRDQENVRELRTLRAEEIEGSAEGFIHTPNPVQYGESLFCGYVLPSTIIQTETGPHPLHTLPSGSRCFATYRPDGKPSAHVSVHRGRTYFWDMSTEPKRFWTMVESLENTQDPELNLRGDSTSAYYASLQEDLQSRLGVEVELLPDQGWLNDQIPELGDDETIFLVAPHGSGKTVLARREHDRAVSSISVCNTQALTIANASVLGLKAVYEGIDPEPKGSACIPSLHRYERPPEFFHVDEADAVHGYLHAGKMEDPLKAWSTLAYFAALSKRCLIASADLGFEDIALFAHAIRERNAARKLRAFIRVPTRIRARLCLRSIRFAKSEIHKTAQSRKPEDPPLFVGISTRRLAGQIAQGYAVTNSLPTVDLDEVASLVDVVDAPEPYRLELPHGQESNVEAPFFVSGENNRYTQSVAWLEDTDSLVRSHDLIVTSPAVQSGVSLDPPVSRSIVLHENRDVPADAVLQIARRARNPKDPNIILGVRNWRKQSHRTDRVFLDDLLRRVSRTTIAAVLNSFPDFKEDHETEPDPEFLWSWRITTRKTVRSYADPIQALKLAAIRHGWDVDVNLEAEADEDSAEAFGVIVNEARKERLRLHAERTAQAEEIEAEEREKLQRAARLEKGEKQKLDRASVADFYAVPVTPELVLLDNSGRYRSKVRAYTHTALVLTGEPGIVAYRDHVLSRGRQASEVSSFLPQALLFQSLLDIVGGELEEVTFRAKDIREPVRLWWKTHHEKAQTFFPRLRGPAPDYEARWLCDRMRALGGRVKTTGANDARRKTINFDEVDQHAEGYAQRLLDLYGQAEAETWRKKWTKKLEQ